MADLNERSIQDFLIYANSVIKSRAIPRVEDNLKPIHRKILWTLYEDKVFADKPTRKCATEAGHAMVYSPHGDASVYGAMVRLAQWWKLRYPLIEMQGNCGNLLGDTAAASRYTDCRLSPLGMLMLEDITITQLLNRKLYLQNSLSCFAAIIAVSQLVWVVILSRITSLRLWARFTTTWSIKIALLRTLCNSSKALIFQLVVKSSTVKNS